MGTHKTAAIIGGGIGGLSAAVGLHRAGWQVRVFERAPHLREAGAGITLWPNALRALKVLGMQDRITVSPQRCGGLRAADGQWLSRYDGQLIEQRLGSPAVGIHRARLHQALLDALPPEALHTGVTIGPKSELPEADLVVGADGIESQVRQRFWPDHPAPVYSGLTAWRGICAPVSDLDVAVTWGPGREAGVVPLEDGRIYWYASMLAAAGSRNTDEKAFVRKEFGSWHEPIPALIDATPADAVLHHDIYHLAAHLPSYVSGQVALLGDAAHAMVPNLGQGACQAIEDAAVLMLAVQKFPAVADALSFYDQQRRPRSQSVAKASAQMLRFGSGLSNPLLVKARNTMIRMTPAVMSIRAMAKVADWTPPSV